ncbi:MAG: hypothetical protein ACTSWW_13260, partial [Promethearchaeota archaeon]
MVQSIIPDTSEKQFNVRNIWPKKIVNQNGDIRPFDPDKMVASLNKETGLDWNLCILVVKNTLKKIATMNIGESIRTTMMRELLSVELIAQGYQKERNIYARLINFAVIKFRLDDAFIDQFREIQPDWGPLGYITYKRTYARLIEEEARTEEFFETVRRVVEGVYSIQKEHCYKLGLPWDDAKSQRSGQVMFRKIWGFKFCPPGRGFWMMGTEFIDKHGSMALNNCGFASTEDIAVKKSQAFEWLMDALMLGVGVGFDTKGAGKLIIQKPKEETFLFEIPDSREGWVLALKYLLLAYFDGEMMPVYDFSKIRLKGTPIRGFGGVASGPAPLKELLDSQKEVLDTRIGQTLTSVDIVDMMNLIGKCVVAGNVRRSAEIALGDVDDEAYITCKQDQKALYHHRWASNNSIIGKKGMDYTKIVGSIAKNGEPGIIYLENARAYSRMGHKADYKDKKAVGVNPCITGDTKIAVADGREAVSIRELADEGVDVPVYCKDTEGRTKIRMMRNPRLTQKDAKILEVLLDDESKIRCTENHEFLLSNGEMKRADELQPRDSLMLMTKWETTWDEIMHQSISNKKPTYWMINDGKKNSFEHTFIYEQLNHTKIQKGWVIHHKDRSGTNNDLANLELMQKKIHDDLHDISGDKNPMRNWYPNATDEEKTRYHDCMSKATSKSNNPNYSGQDSDFIYQNMLDYIDEKGIPLTVAGWKEYAKKNGFIYYFTEYRGKLLNLIKLANISKGFEHYENPALMREYKRYIKLLQTSDLEVEFDQGIWIKRQCEICNSEFRVKYGRREQAFCSKSCSNKYAATFAGKKTKELGLERQTAVKKQIVKLFKKFVLENQYIPNAKDFLELLNQNGINDLRTAGLSNSYQKFLEEMGRNHDIYDISVHKLRNQDYREKLCTRFVNNGLSHNHKILSIKNIGSEDVYNGTVDDFHNYGIVLDLKETKTNRRKMEIIFAANCGEQTLESFELCCLVETFPSRHESYVEFEETLKYAYLYAKSVTLVNTHWDATNAVMGKNRRIGTSQTGIIDAFARHGRRTILNWADRGYNYLRELDEKYSDFFCVPQSIKITTVKPSGTVSLLPGVSPGIHYPHAEYYIRRIRISKESTLIDILREANYPVEQDAYSENSMVVEFPVNEKNFLRSKKDASLWEQLANAVDYQHYWSDNQVSITVTFTEDEVKDIPYALEFIEDKLKGLSLLPLTESGYRQMPYETITKEEYESRKAVLK